MAEKCMMKSVKCDPAHPGSLGGVENLQRGVQEEKGKMLLWSMSEIIYQGRTLTLHIRPS